MKTYPSDSSAEVLLDELLWLAREVSQALQSISASSGLPEDVHLSALSGAASAGTICTLVCLLKKAQQGNCRGSETASCRASATISA